MNAIGQISSIGKKPVDADYSALTEEIETNSKASKLQSRKVFLAKFTPKIGLEKYQRLILFKINPWTNRIKDSKGEKMIGSFYEKELLLSKL